MGCVVTAGGMCMYKVRNWFFDHRLSEYPE
jgi:hypothetical protein